MTDKFALWKSHFEKQARGLIPRENSFYKVASSPQDSQRGLLETRVTFAPSTQQAVERAKIDLKNPEPIYDPVLGIQRHSSAKPRSVKKSRKRVSKKATSKRKKRKSIPKKKKGKKRTNKKTSRRK